MSFILLLQSKTTRQNCRAVSILLYFACFYKIREARLYSYFVLLENDFTRITYW